MDDLACGIREVEFSKGEFENESELRVVFGPHYILEIKSNKNGKVTFTLVATHHGFKADATLGELEDFIGEIRDKHPENVVD